MNVDAAPIRMHEPASAKTIEAVVTFVIDALECGQEAAAGAPAPPIEQSGRRAFSASSAEDVRATSGRVETPSCIVETTRTSTFFPGDVNEPPWEREDVVVEGTRRDGSCRMRVFFNVGDTAMSIDVNAPPQVRKRIMKNLSHAFGRPSR